MRDRAPFLAGRKGRAAATAQATPVEDVDERAARGRHRSEALHVGVKTLRPARQIGAGEEAQPAQGSGLRSTPARKLARCSASGSLAGMSRRYAVAKPTAATHTQVRARNQIDHESVPVPRPCTTPIGQAA